MSADHQGEEHPRWQRFRDWGEFVFALVLTIYGVAGYYAVSHQLDLMWLQTAITQDQILGGERSERRARQDIERQFQNAASQARSMQYMSLAAMANAISQLQIASAARTSAINSGKAIANSENQFRVSEQPRIVFDGVGGHEQPPTTITVGVPFNEFVYFRNTGRSSATVDKVQFCVQIAFRLAPEVTCARRKDMTLDWGPDTPQWMVADFPVFTETQVADLATNKQRLWIVYRLEYRDVFMKRYAIEGCQMRDATTINGWAYCVPPVKVKPD